MTEEDLREAAYILKTIEEFDRTTEKYTAMEVDFVDGDRRRSMGHLEVSESTREEFLSTMREAAANWFAAKRSELKKQLEELGVDV